MIPKTLLSIFLLVSACTITQAQTYQLKPPFGTKEKMEILTYFKELFSMGATFSYQISLDDPIADYSKMADQKPYDDNYLRDLEKIWEADTLNPIIANNLGNYYNFHEHYDSALLFFRKSKDKLAIKYFNSDSAFYFSFRGTLNLNLGEESAIDDFDRALKINSNDSIARAFYPLLLLNRQEYKKVADLCVSMLEDPKVDPLYPYVFLITSELSGGLISKLREANADEKTKTRYANTDYDKLMNFTLVDKYAEKYKTNLAMRNARYMSDIFALCLKLALFNNADNPDSVFQYTTNDRARLASLEKFFLAPTTKKELNPYTLNKCLGFVYFMQQQKDKAILAFNTAIKAFPLNKKWQYFNPAEMYEALAGIYFLYKDTASFRQAVMTKIADEPSGKKEVRDYFVMAEYYFNAGDMIKAEEWANKGKQVNANDFDNLRMLIHLNFLNAKSDVVQAYADKAAKLIQTNEQQYNLLIQFALYQLFNGDPTTAYNNIEIARKSMEGQDCDICDKVVKKYIIITK